jgi:subfamily B ATP-binding cassette protein MsbA
VAAGLGPRFAVPILLLAALVVRNVFAYLSEFALNSIGLAMVRDLRRDAYRALLDQSSRFSAETSSGDLMSRILTDAEQIQVAFGSRLADFVQGCLTMLLVLLYVFSLHFRLALSVLVVTPLLIGPIIGNYRRLRRATLAARQRIGEMGAILGETVRGRRLIQTYAMEDFEAERFRRVNRRYFDATRASIRLQALNPPLMEILAGVGLALVFVYAAEQIHAGRMTVGGLLSFQGPPHALQTAQGRRADQHRGQVALASTGGSSRSSTPRTTSSSGPARGTSGPARHHPLRGRDVRLRRRAGPVGHRPDDPARRDGGDRGTVGAGKTTLVNLLRLYDPMAGRIAFDGVDVRDATLGSLRRQSAS